jgi:hypothetical protein
VIIRPESFKPCIGFKDEFYRRDLIYRAQNLYLVPKIEATFKLRTIGKIKSISSLLNKKLAFWVKSRL